MLFEKLSQSDLQIIGDWITFYGISNRERNDFPYYRFASLERILDSWDRNKQKYLWKMFNEQFILEREVSYQRPNTVLEQQLDKGLDEAAMGTFQDKLYKCVEKYYNYYSDECYTLRHLFDTAALRDNRWERASTAIIFDGKAIEIPRGAKLMKILNKFAKYFHLEQDFENFRIAHSQILNQKLLQGTLCLSIHPFDYMTLSDNTYGWDSCMNWENNGCYRTGTIEMMNSPYVVVAYLKGEHAYRVGNEYWSGNKKWRELFVVHPQGICNIKPYPYMNTTMSSIALEWLCELAAQNLDWQIPYEPHQFKNMESFVYYDNRRYRYHFYTNYMYNDFNTYNTNHMIAIPQNWQKNDNSSNEVEINISGPNICACCACEWEPREGHEDQVLCPDCDSGVQCSCCGDECDEDDMFYVEGDLLCEYCYHEEAECCALSEDYYYNDNMEEIHLTAVPDNVDHLHYLNSCYVHKNYVQPNALRYWRQYFPDLDTIHSIEKDGQTIYYVNMDDCSDSCLIDLFYLYQGRSRTRYVEEYPEATTS